MTDLSKATLCYHLLEMDLKLNLSLNKLNITIQISSLKLLSSTTSRRNFSEENLTVATAKIFCQSKTSPMIANNLNHKTSISFNKKLGLRFAYIN